MAGGIAYLGNEDPTEINGPILVHSSVIQNVMAFIGEAEYAAAFYTRQVYVKLCLILDILSLQHIFSSTTKLPLELLVIQLNPREQKVSICSIIGYEIAFRCKNS